jgi:hypothetical protein
MYDDDRAAAVWFIDTFVPAHSGSITGNYLSFQVWQKVQILALMM